MEPFTEEQKAWLRKLIIWIDQRTRSVMVRDTALVVLLGKKGLITPAELEAAIREEEASLALDATLDPSLRSLEQLLGEGPQEERQEPGG